jgi:hypothetical protein
MLTSPPASPTDAGAMRNGEGVPNGPQRRRRVGWKVVAPLAALVVGAVVVAVVRGGGGAVGPLERGGRASAAAVGEVAYVPVNAVDMNGREATPSTRTSPAGS